MAPGHATWVWVSFGEVTSRKIESLIQRYSYGAKQRSSTYSEPFILISGAVHHWDENGRFPNETTSTIPPPAITETQAIEVKFVQAWMTEWQQRRTGYGQTRDGYATSSLNMALS